MAKLNHVKVNNSFQINLVHPEVYQVSFQSSAKPALSVTTKTRRKWKWVCAVIFSGFSSKM